MRRATEKGEATAVLIGLLVVALVAALGWIFYQNLTEKDTASNDTQLSSVKNFAECKNAANSTIKEPRVCVTHDGQEFVDDTPIATPNVEDKKADATLELTKWGVAIPLDEADEAYGLTAVLTDGRYEVRSTAVAEKCKEGGTGSIGRISNQTEDASYARRNGGAVVDLSGVTYSFSPPQSACADPMTSNGKTANAYMADATEHFKNTFKGLKISK